MRQPPGNPTLPILGDLPPGYFVEEAPGGVLAISIDYARGLHGLGFGPEEDGKLEDSDLHGRKPLFQFDLGDERLVLRRYNHGGLLRWATGARFSSLSLATPSVAVASQLHRSSPPDRGLLLVVAGTSTWSRAVSKTVRISAR